MQKVIYFVLFLFYYKRKIREVEQQHSMYIYKYINIASEYVRKFLFSFKNIIYMVLYFKIFVFFFAMFWFCLINVYIFDEKIELEARF